MTFAILVQTLYQWATKPLGAGSYIYVNLNDEHRAYLHNMLEVSEYSLHPENITKTMMVMIKQAPLFTNVLF